MPTDSSAPTNRIDDEGLPIAIGFQTVADEPTSAIVEREQTPTVSGARAERQEPLTGYKLVKDMMRRQDEVLKQLDDLNARVESTIEQISAVRKTEIEAMDAESADSASSFDESIDQRKAA